MSDLKIKELFTRPITRHINGVVKAEQMDAESVWQELDEFVVTRELIKQLRRFIDAYVTVMDNPNDPSVAAGMGVWISGFFGSGKSHLLKVLAHLLTNNVHSHGGEQRHAFDFFEAKIDDAMLVGDIKRVVAPSTDVILFNIDSKAEAQEGRDAILQVFLKVLNELQGYSPDHPHIAHMERYLDQKGKLAAFHAAFTEATGSDWVDERDAYEFNRDEVIQAFMKATGQSETSAEKWIDNAEENFSLTVERFAGWVKEYLDSKGPEHRVLFFVDEIGQFIGDDTHLMLNLQTLTENLGTTCGGRAWVVVTSQEDIDSVIGEVKTSKANDFSKIQGRFRTKLSLSSANVDEVIQSRLLDKTDDAITELKGIWQEKEDVLRHQVALPHTAMTFKSYTTEKDFVLNYPFIPYQFMLLQKVFEAIRKIGASGQHLSRGERSILDAFQVACTQIQDEGLGELVPLWRFYPAIEGFLDTAVAKTISNAADNASLNEFDVHLLKGLFLIRYVEEIKGTVDNLVTLCLEEIDQDRIELKAQITASLERLEGQNLVKRTGDQYFFLTNEEQDITREIKHVDLSPGEDNTYLSQLIFDEVLKQLRKHRHHENKLDFDVNRIADGRPYSAQRDDALRIHVISTINEDHESFDKSRCLLESSTDHGQVLIVMPMNNRVARDLRACVQTEKYLRRKHDGSQGDNIKRILRDVADDNQSRKGQLVKTLASDFESADWYVAGQNFDPKGTAPEAQVGSALDLLIDSTFTKRGLLVKVLDETSCKHEIQSVLRSNDADKQTALIQLEESNPKAIEEVRTYIELSDAKHQQVIVGPLLDRFHGRPYAWPALDTALLLARLLVAGEITFIKNGANLPIDKCYGALTVPAERKTVTIKKRKTANPAALRRAKQIGKDLFGQNFPEDEIPLFEELRTQLRGWEEKLKEYRPLAENAGYPGKTMIADALAALSPLTIEEDSARFIERLNAADDALSDVEEDVQQLADFYDHQKPAWDRLCKSLTGFDQNRYELEADTDAAESLEQLRQIRSDESPFQKIKTADPLISKVQATNDALATEARKIAVAAVEAQRAILVADLDAAKPAGDVREHCLKPFDQLAIQVGGEAVLGQLKAVPERAANALRTGQQRLEQAIKEQKPTPGDPPKPILKPTTTLRVTELAGATLIETDEQADALADKLRAQLKQAIADGKRIQIR